VNPSFSAKENGSGALEKWQFQINGSDALEKWQ
jgi:hypothetical protein